MTRLSTALKILLLCLSTEVSARELRLVSLTPAITQTLDALGGGSYLVGADQASGREDLPVIADYRQINVEAIVRLNPSHVIAWQDSLKPGVQAQLSERFGIKVLVSQTQSIEQWLNSSRQIAMELGLNSDPIQAWESELEGIESLYAQRQEHPNRLVILGSACHGGGTKGFTSEIMRICGLQNAFKDIDTVTATIDPEQLLRRSPQVLIGRAESIDLNMWDQSPFIWEPPSDSLSQPGPALPKGILALWVRHSILSVRRFELGYESPYTLRAD